MLGVKVCNKTSVFLVPKKDTQNPSLTVIKCDAPRLVECRGCAGAGVPENRDDLDGASAKFKVRIVPSLSLSC